MEDIRKTDLAIQIAEMLLQFPVYQYRKMLSDWSFRLNIVLAGGSSGLRRAFEDSILYGTVMYDTDVVITQVKNEEELRELLIKKQSGPECIYSVQENCETEECLYCRGGTLAEVSFCAWISDSRFFESCIDDPV